MGIIVIDEELLDTALESAGRAGRAGGLAVRGLNAPLDSSQTTWTERLWDTAQGAVRVAWEKGKEAAKELLERFHVQLQELGGTIGETASRVRRVISERFNQLFASLVGGALERFQPKITVASRDIMLRSVTIEQSLKMSASLKTSLEELCEFVAEGELTVSAEYGTG